MYTGTSHTHCIHGNSAVAKCNIVLVFFLPSSSFSPELRMGKLEVYNCESERKFRHKHKHSYMQVKLLTVDRLLWQHINVFAVDWHRHNDTDQWNEKRTFFLCSFKLYVFGICFCTGNKIANRLGNHTIRISHFSCKANIEIYVLRRIATVKFNPQNRCWLFGWMKMQWPMMNGIYVHTRTQQPVVWLEPMWNYCQFLLAVVSVFRCEPLVCLMNRPHTKLISSQKDSSGCVCASWFRVVPVIPYTFLCGDRKLNG